MQTRYSPDPFDTCRPLWKSRLYAYTLAAAILGMMAVLGWFGFIAYTL